VPAERPVKVAEVLALAETVTCPSTVHWYSAESPTPVEVLFTLTLPLARTESEKDAVPHVLIYIVSQTLLSQLRAVPIVKQTTYDRLALVYVCVGFLSVEVVPSPNDQLYEVIESDAVEVLVITSTCAPPLVVC
jgi:hypothetical protein